MAVGEYESLALLVTAAGRIREEHLRFEELPRHVSVETRIATPYLRKLPDGEAVTEPYLLEVVESVSFKQPGKSLYWLTFHAEPGARPGTRNVTIRLREASVKVALTVRPFRLRRDPGVFYGAFCGRSDVAIRSI